MCQSRCTSEGALRIIGNCGRFRGFYIGFGVNLTVETQEPLAGVIIESCKTHSDGFGLVTEDRPGVHDVHQTAGRNDFVNRTLIEGLADDFRPGGQMSSEVRIVASGLGENLLLGGFAS